MGLAPLTHSLLLLCCRPNHSLLAPLLLPEPLAVAPLLLPEPLAVRQVLSEYELERLVNMQRNSVHL